MPIHHNLIKFLYHPHKLFKSIYDSSKNDLRIVLYHDIPKNQQYLFYKQLIWLKQYWNFIDPDDFFMMMKGEKPIVGRNLLITFDDGFYSNRQVAEFILKPLKIKGIFFIVPKFIELHNTNFLADFVYSNIFPNAKYESRHSNWQSMSWDDITWLLNNGHTIGSHTFSHLRLSDIKSSQELEYEIVQSKNIIKERLGILVDNFAYTFGDLDSFNNNALQIASMHYRYIYSGLRGSNHNKLSSYCIRRDAAAGQDKNLNYVLYNNKLLAGFLNGLADTKYYRDLKRFDRWAYSLQRSSKKDI